MQREKIFELIVEERARQDKLHPLPKIKPTDSEEVKTFNTIINTTELLAVLVEEVGEVAQAIQGEGSLQDELIQVASVCVRWLEILRDKNPA